jgi:hypothetical protein
MEFEVVSYHSFWTYLTSRPGGLTLTLLDEGHTIRPKAKIAHHYDLHIGKSSFKSRS